MTPATLLAARVDWLEVAFRVDFDARALSLLGHRAEASRRNDCAVPVVLGAYALKLHPPSRTGKWLLQNADARVTVQEHAPGNDNGGPGWTVRAEFSGTALLALGWRAAIEHAWAIAGELGDVLEARCGRTDLAADLANYDMRPDDRNSFLKVSRVRSSDHLADGKPRQKRGSKKRRTDGTAVRKEAVVYELDKRKIQLRDEGKSAEHYVGGTFSGFSFGSRTSVSARIYDKRLELLANADKRTAEEAVWRGSGWDGEAPVTRVEFEVRGEALEELKVRHTTRGAEGVGIMVERFGAALDGLWGYCTGKWLRLVRRGEKRRTLQPRWRVVQSAVFVAAAEPRERHRTRGAAKAAQAEGAVLSLLGSMHDLPPTPWAPAIDSQTGEVDEERLGDDERRLVDEFCEQSLEPDTAAVCAAELARELREQFRRAADHVIAYERERASDARGALERCWARRRAALARFTPCPDDARASPAAVAAA